MVEQIKKGWVSWVFQGIPAAGIVLGAMLTFWGEFTTLKNDVVELKTNQTLLSEQLTSTQKQIETLQGELVRRGNLSAAHHKKPIEFDREPISDLPPTYRSLP